MDHQTKIHIPEILKDEFQTVEAVLSSNANTMAVDAFILSWTKYEKQFRRLFMFLVYQSRCASIETRGAIEEAVCKNARLYPKQLMLSIEKIGSTNISALVGDQHGQLSEQIESVKTYRDKIIHGQQTGKKADQKILLDAIQTLVKWMGLLGDGAEIAYGYNGVDRNTFKKANRNRKSSELHCQFETVEDLLNWIKKIR